MAKLSSRTLFIAIATIIATALLSATTPAMAQMINGTEALMDGAGGNPEQEEMRELLQWAYGHGATFRDPTDPTRQGTNMGHAGVNPVVAEYLEKAQKALDAGNYLEALANAKAAQAVVTNDYEDLKVYQFLIYCNLKTNHREQAMDEAVKAADLATISNDERRELYTDAIVLSFNLKKYDRALEYAHKMQDLNLKDPLAQQAIGQALYYGGENDQAKALLKKLVDNALASGQTPTESLLGILASAQAKGYEQIDVEKTLDMLGANYDKPFYWQSMVDFAFFKPDLSDLGKVWLGRLMFASGAAISQQNADRIGGAANNLGIISAAARWQNVGAKGYDIPNDKLAADEDSMPQQIIASGSMDGNGNARLAESLYDYGQFNESEAAARRALAKGVGDPAEAQMMLGMALYAQGKFADSATAFAQVKRTGGDADVAHLWATLAQHKTKMPATTSASAAK